MPLLSSYVDYFLNLFNLFFVITYLLILFFLDHVELYSIINSSLNY